jgi:putative ABC transport system permease protein
VGLYGVLSTVVRQRTAEIGVRMAFGAPKSSIFQLVIGQGLRLSAIGVALGIAGALALTRGMSSMLVGVRPTDPLTFIAIAVVFMVIAGVSSWLPARRAASLDPNVALSKE